MQDNIPCKTYRNLLAEREGRGFSEQKITELLREVLLELVPMHTQSIIHGDISLDTLAQNLKTLQTVLIKSQEANPSKQVSAAEDIYNLGVTAIILLTGKSLEDLQDPDGSWQWQDYRLVSDQLATILNKAISKDPTLIYPSAVQMLNDLSDEVKSSVSPLTKTQGSSVTTSSFEVTKVSSLSDFFIRRWQMLSIGTFILLSLFGIWVYANKPQSSTYNSPITGKDSLPPPSPSPSTTSTNLIPPTNNIPPNQSPQLDQPSALPNLEKGATTQVIPSINSTSEEKVRPTDFPRFVHLIGQTPGSRVNVRSAPSISSDSLHYGLVGDRVTALQQHTEVDGKTWYFVQFSSGATGWIRGDFIGLQ